MNTRAALGPSNSSYGCIVFSHGHSTFKARYRIDHALIAAVHQIACIVNGENNYYTCMKYIYIYSDWNRIFNNRTIFFRNYKLIKIIYYYFIIQYNLIYIYIFSLLYM